jgi:hypothetical protein
MYSRWTQHLNTEEEKERFRNEIHSARRVLERLKDMVDEDLSMMDKSEQDQRIYDLPNWDYRQAHKNGGRQYATQMYNLVNLDHQKGPKN